MCDIILRRTYLNLLPIEILKIVISQIDDIDIKRHFDCYNRLNIDKYNYLNTITINSPVDINNQWMLATFCKFQKNLYDFDERKKYRVPDDHIIINNFTEKSYIMIHRLVLKSKIKDEIIRELEDKEIGLCSTVLTNSLRPPPYLYGTLGDYRWEVIKTIKKDNAMCNEL